MRSDHNAEARAESPGRSPAQWFCLIGGLILLVRGTIGVVADPSFGTPGDGWHQLFHLSSGAILLAMSRRQGVALALTLGFAAVYGAVALIGLIDGEQIVGLFAVDSSDHAIHGALTLAAFGAGLATLVRYRPRPAAAP